MTLLQIINLIKETALAQPNVNTFVRNFLDLNREHTKYSAIVLQDRDGLRDRIQEQDWNTFTFHLGYVDRLTFDESNRDDIFSTGVNIINNIVASLRQRWFPDIEVSVIDRFSTFDQRFTASCAGVYVVLAIQIPVSDCVDSEQTNIYDTYQAKFTENGHYHFVPDGKPYDEIDITVDVQGAKPEEIGSGVAEVGPAADIKRYYPSEGYVFREFEVLPVNAPVLYRTITGNGDYYFEPTESGEEAYSAVSLSVEVPSKEERPLIPDTITENGEFHYTPEHYSYVYKFAEIEVDVHPSESLVEAITTNGSHTYTGEWTNAVISVDVHPSQMLRRTLSDAGGLHIEGEWTNASIDLDMNVYNPTFTSNGVFTADNIFADQAEVTVNVHPSQSLVQNISTNGSHSFSGEWTDATITVAVPVPTMTTLTETLTSNSTYSFTAPSGQAYDSVLVTVSVPSDMKPETICDEIIQENGSHHYTPPTGEVFSNVHITTDVHPSMSLVETITTNGSHSFSGEWTNAVITVDVSSSSKPEETLTQNISANGGYHYNPTPGYVFGSADISVDVHPSQRLIETIAVNGTRTFTGEWNGATITTDVHPSQSLVQSISTNGVTSLSGEWTDAEITVDVHPSMSLVQNISTNGVTSLSGEWTNAEITVAVPTTLTVTMTQSQYDALSVKDSNTIYLING
jgi:RNA polymerase subunit RPABC4/transcription elongation factor Spt4